VKQDHQTGTLSTKDVLSTALIWGMILVLPVGVTSDWMKVRSAAGAIHNLWPGHFWAYLAITCLGGLLAWSIPKSLSSWEGAKDFSVLIHLVLIGTATHQLLGNLVRNSLGGASFNFVFFVASIGILVFAQSQKKQSRSK
jgi:hypothetical protein